MSTSLRWNAFGLFFMVHGESGHCGTGTVRIQDQDPFLHEMIQLYDA